MRVVLEYSIVLTAFCLHDLLSCLEACAAAEEQRHQALTSTITVLLAYADIS